MNGRVCHISTVHSSDDDRIFFKECKTLTENYDVYFIVTNRKFETIDNVHIIPLPYNTSRVYRFFVKQYAAFWKAVKVKADIYHFHDPELIFIGVLLKLFGKKVIYDVHEDVPLQILSKEWLGSLKFRKAISGIFNFIEKGLSKHFDGVITVTSGIKKKFSCKRTVVVRNLPIKSLIDKVSPVDRVKEKPVVIYVGGLTKIRGIQELVDVAGRLNGHVELWLLGKWESDDFKNLCEQTKGWEYTKYFGFMPMDEVYQFLKKADIGCCTLYETGNHLNSLPVKAYEYMTCSLPIIMSKFPLWIENFKDCSLFVDPLNIDEIKEGIIRLLNDKCLRETLIENGRMLIESKYTWESESKRLIDLYEDIMRKM